MARTLDIKDFLIQDRLAVQISDMFTEFEMYRNTWMNQKDELREYIFATDTQGTSNDSLPWKNNVHIPKLCQIRDNLHANYMATLFPNDRHLVWEGDDLAAESKAKREAIQSYMENKLNAGKFRTEVSKLVYDWIDWGNCFALTEFIAESTTDEFGAKISGFVGPKVRRISPLDIVFNPTADQFDASPKIIRSLKGLGTLKADIQDHPEMGYLEEIFERVEAGRQKFEGATMGDFRKAAGFQIDGFSSWLDYFQSDYVEILDFYGDIYDRETQKLYKNHLITVVDRCYVIRSIPNPSWLGKSPIKHCGWRLRPDNLYAMGPLDNLVGMQYRIDHLENAKSDAFDLIIHPVMKIKGYVDDFDYEPNARIFMGDDGDVEFMSPDVTMLNADTQIAMYEAKMEEMAGAPKQAMGFRTPGEKTAYEVQVLENGANRIFLNKTSYFEEVFMEPLIQDMLETARRNMGVSDLIRVMDDQYGVVDFMKVTRADISASGKIRPVGARHFARNANILQNLTQFSQSPLGQDPSVSAHISGKAVARLVEELLQLRRYDIVQDNIRVFESAETQKLVGAAQQQIMEQMQPDANQMVPGQEPGGAGGTPQPVQ